MRAKIDQQFLQEFQRTQAETNKREERPTKSRKSSQSVNPQALLTEVRGGCVEKEEWKLLDVVGLGKKKTEVVCVLYHYLTNPTALTSIFLAT